jgi:hypothetical protein
MTQAEAKADQGIRVVMEFNLDSRLVTTLIPDQPGHPEVGAVVTIGVLVPTEKEAP